MTGFEVLSLLIPVVGGLILKRLYPDRIVWWEAILPLAPVLLIVPVLHVSVESALTRSTERHGGWVVEACYDEPWDEYIHQICSRTVSCGKDCTTTEFYDCSYVANHPPAWWVVDSNKEETAISEETYKVLSARFGGSKFVDMQRNYHSYDGDRYVARYPVSEQAFTPIVLSHDYEHRPQAARGVFHFEDYPNWKELGLFAYPELNDIFNDPAILGACEGSAEADQQLQRINARLGALKQVRIWVLLFHDKPQEIGWQQEAHWYGGQNNEFVVAIGLQGGKPTWAHPFCWSPDGDATNDTLGIHVRDQIMLHPERFDIRKTVDFIGQEVRAHWRRKPRKELDYLHVELPTWAGWTSIILSTLTLCGVGYFVVTNEANVEHDLPFGYVRRRRGF